ncbi:MAG: YfhO family protein [Synechococcales cyanobacterium RM1_1_8]|nr:YfhO family protein [Synechococcales cyanobacterium RM1_1_8]
MLDILVATMNTWLGEKDERIARDSILAFIGFLLLYVGFFSPVLFSDFLLGPGDGVTYYIPAFYALKTLWSNLIFAGYPVAADPQMMTWYPVARLLYYFPSGWNIFVLSAYVLAATFTFAYVRTIVGSRLAGIVSALTYSMSGFMFSHLSHTTMIHGAAWLPLALLSFEKLRHTQSRVWSVVGTFAISCTCLSGHPQISFYIISLILYYSIYIGFRDRGIGWRSYAVRVALIMILGIGACSVQIFPTIELSQISSRADMSYENFISYSLPLRQSAMLFFPFIFGNFVTFGPYSAPYWADWNLAEISGYIGLLPLILACSSLKISGSKKKTAVFWMTVALIALLLSYGDDFFLARLFHLLPGYGRFRAQGRHLIEFNFAISILAGFGIEVLRRNWTSPQIPLQAIGIVSTLMLSSLGIAFINPEIRTAASSAERPLITSWPWENLSIGIPILILIGSAAIVLVWRRRPYANWASASLLLMLFIDLSSFSWYSYWHPVTPPKSLLNSPSPIAKTYRPRLLTEHQRILDPRGTLGYGTNGIFPNMNRLWGVPIAGGYSPLLISRFGELLGMGEAGEIAQVPLEKENRSLDIVGVKYLVAPNLTQLVPEESKTIPLELPPLGIGPCSSNATRQEVKLPLPSGVPTQGISAIKIFSSLGCSTDIGDNSDVLVLKITDVNDQSEEVRLKAGRDTSETFYDCPDVLPLMKHSRVSIASRSNDIVRDNNIVCKSNEYVTEIPLASPKSLKELEFSWVGPSGGMTISRLELVEHSTQRNYQIPPMYTELALNSRWKRDQAYGPDVVYENKQVMPRAWLVSDVRQAEQEDILSTIQTSVFPSGEEFKPEEMALVEEDLALGFQPLSESDKVEILNIQDMSAEYITQSKSDAFLVISDVWFPGWQAKVDNKRVQLYQTDYVIRGVKIPAGQHQITFSYEPWSFKVGVFLSLASLTLGLCLVIAF